MCCIPREEHECTASVGSLLCHGVSSPLVEVVACGSALAELLSIWQITLNKYNMILFLIQIGKIAQRYVVYILFFIKYTCVLKTWLILFFFLLFLLQIKG